jgi:hypothetical protein
MVTRKHLIITFYIRCLKETNSLTRVVADILRLTKRYHVAFTANVNLFHYSFFSRNLNFAIIVIFVFGRFKANII